MKATIKRKLINLRIKEEKHNQYMQLAKKKGMTLSKLIRQLLEEELTNDTKN